MSVRKTAAARYIIAGICALTIGASVFALPASADPYISALAGSWSGGGHLKLEDGHSERLSCRANYNPSNRGSSLGMSIRCASQSYKIELRSSLSLIAGRVFGSWEERSFNASGAISGRSTAGQLSLSFSGTITGSLHVRYGAGVQRVSIRPQGSGLSSVSVKMSRR